MDYPGPPGPSRKGGWVYIQILGSGGFGTVYLYKHEETGEQLAIKNCRLKSEMTEKHRKRWALEVAIMLKLKHENVVAARDVPPALDVEKNKLPLLAMEYCSGGDLRKVLNHPENCCGLNEYTVRCLVQDIAAAIEYLHSHKIIHRDLKPENIVLQPTEERTIYKLIDLGYAKELDQGSVCTSFVGTLQYLAPELFANHKYDKTVDFWSFGTVVFECIVGYRPFLPNIPPVRWHGEVLKKSQDDIMAYDVKNVTKFSKNIPHPNHLSRTLQACFEQWLRLMLRWDSNVRGGGVSQENNRPKCFTLLDNMLGMKIVHVLHVSANQLLSYPVMEQHTVLDLQQIIELETKIPVAEQEILLASGVSPDPQLSASSQCWLKPSWQTEDDWVVFLFNKSQSEFGSAQQTRKPLPDLVQRIVSEPSTLLQFSDQKKAWAQAVFFCQQQYTDLKRLTLGQRAAMLCLLRENTTYRNMNSKMLVLLSQLQPQHEFFNIMLDYDMQKYKEQASNGGITSTAMYQKWEKIKTDTDQFLILKDKSAALEDECRVVQTKIVGLQRSPSSKPRHTEALDAQATDAQKLYHELRQTPKERRNDTSSHSSMVHMVVMCVQTRNKAITDLNTHLTKITACKKQIEVTMPRLTECCHEIEVAIEKIRHSQKLRQHDIWFLMKNALNKSVAGDSNSITMDSKLNSLLNSLEKNSDVSYQAVENSNATNAEIETLYQSIRSENDNCLSLLDSMNWDFLEENNEDSS